MSTTVRDLVTAAFREIGVLGVGESLSDDLASVGLFSLQTQLDAWQADRLDLAVQTRVTFPLVSGTSTVTIGTGGSVTTTPATATAPMWLDTVTYVIPGSNPAIEVKIGQMDRDTYARLTIKSLGSSLPLQYFYQRSNTDALGSLFIWPQVTQNLTVVLYAPQGVGVPATINDTIIGPPGYADAFRYDLAVRLCPMTGTTIPDGLPQLRSMAMRRMQRPNVLPATMSVDPAVTNSSNAGYNILTDTTQVSR